jgi:hypothetical protein
MNVIAICITSSISGQNPRRQIYMHAPGLLQYVVNKARTALPSSAIVCVETQPVPLVTHFLGGKSFLISADCGYLRRYGGGSRNPLSRAFKRPAAAVWGNGLWGSVGAAGRSYD